MRNGTDQLLIDHGLNRLLQKLGNSCALVMSGLPAHGLIAALQQGFKRLELGFQMRRLCQWCELIDQGSDPGVVQLFAENMFSTLEEEKLRS